MPTYIYRAKQGPTRTIEGELDAETRAAAVAEMDRMGYSPVWVKEKPIEKQRAHPVRTRKISGREVTIFTRQLASLLKSGVPILRALSTIRDQSENIRMKRVLEDLESTIRDGKMLSDALSKYPRLFSELYVNMVRSGESGGILDHILLRLSEAREREDELRRKAQAAAAYPALILTVGIVTVFVLLTFFLPRVVELFKDYEQLPLPTRLLMGVSGFFSDYWLWLVLSIVLFITVLKRMAALERGRTFIDTIKLHIPVVGNFFRESDIARFARTFSLLLDAGVPIEKALSLSASVLQNTVLREEIEMVRSNAVQQGATVSSGLRKARYFPPFVANMAAVGEEAGRLDESLLEIAVFYEGEVDHHSRIATSLLEPVLILVVGVIVGLIVAAMLLPIFEIGTSLG